MHVAPVLRRERGSLDDQLVDDESGKAARADDHEAQLHGAYEKGGGEAKKGEDEDGEEEDGLTVLAQRAQH